MYKLLLYNQITKGFIHAIIMLSRTVNQKGAVACQNTGPALALRVEVIILARVFEYFWANAKSICLPGMRATANINERKTLGEPVRFCKRLLKIPDFRCTVSGMTY